MSFESRINASCADGQKTKENAMNATGILVTMLLLRLIIPLGLLLWIGEIARRRQLASLHRA